MKAGKVMNPDAGRGGSIRRKRIVRTGAGGEYAGSVPFHCLISPYSEIHFGRQSRSASTVLPHRKRRPDGIFSYNLISNLYICSESKNRVQ